MRKSMKKPPDSPKRKFLVFLAIVIPPALLVIAGWLYLYRDLVFSR